MKGGAVRQQMEGKKKGGGADTSVRGPKKYQLVSNPDIPPLTKEEKAAIRIARIWRKRTRGLELKRDVFIERLVLEDTVCVGVTRLILFVILFFFLIQATSVGTPVSDQRAVEIVLTQALGLEDVSDIERLVDYRDKMVEMSAAVKPFSASGTVRFPDPNSVTLIGAEEVFSEASSLSDLSVNVAADFTLTAWVRRRHTEQVDRPIFRKPLATNNLLNCWGWYFPSAAFFGAHDYHSSTMDIETSWQEAVRADTPYPSGSFSHEAMVVQNRSVFFYRDGLVLNKGGTRLDREITDCKGTIEIGGPGLSLAQVKFYARALPPTEIMEINVNGQPLAEMVTGSTPTPYSADDHENIILEVNSAAANTKSDLAAVDQQRRVDDAVADAEIAEDADDLESILYPLDPSPAPTLPSFVDSSGLPSRERDMWQAGGFKTSLGAAVVDAWQSGGSQRRAAEDSWWSVLEDPVYPRPADGPEEDHRGLFNGSVSLAAMNLTGADAAAAAEVLTFAFWVKATDPKLRFSLALRVGKPGERDVLGYHLLSYGGEVLRVSDGAGATYMQQQEDFVAANQDVGPLNEKFYITGFNHGTLPTVWRHVAVQFYLKEGKNRFYLDGRLAGEHHWHGVSNIPLSALEGTHVALTQAASWSTGRVLAKVAQLRMYAGDMSPAAIQQLQDTAVWPDGTAIKQCRELDDDSLVDTSGLDHQGRSCAWYAEMVQAMQSNLVCDSAAARAMCPLTCRGVRECNAGFPYDGQVHDEAASERRAGQRKYRIFERVMHIKPQDRTAICPGDSVYVDALMAQCVVTAPSYQNLPNFYEGWEESVLDSWAEYGRADLSKCQDLAARMDKYQCGWDDSWMGDLKAEVEEAEALSVNWWAHSAPLSRGMPRQFQVAVNMFASMVPPQTLFDVREQNPFQEATTRLAMPTTEGQVFSDIQHGGSVDFVGAWTFYHVSFQKVKEGLHVGQWEQCLTVNAFPAVCKMSGPPGATPGFLPLTEDFLTAFEVTNELYMSPIELSTEVLTSAQLQLKYYRTAPKMMHVIGPERTELSRLTKRDLPTLQKVNSFSERIILAAPPVVYQRRNLMEDCGSEVMHIFLEKQLELIQDTHCSASGECPTFLEPQDVFPCLTSDPMESGKFFGLNSTKFNGQAVYADFLFAIADNDVLVRDGEVVTAIEFVDQATEWANTLFLFHSPDTGDTTVLDVRLQTLGAKVKATAKFRHFSFLDEAQRTWAAVLWSIVFVLSGVVVALGLFSFLAILADARNPDVGWNYKELFEICYDWSSVGVMFIYGIVKIVAQVRSEGDAKNLVEDFVSVPFRASNETVQTKVDLMFEAVDRLEGLLTTEDTTTVIGFIIMFGMLIRIINATAVHPRTAVLIGTIKAGLNDIWHFAILFMIVFYFSSLVAVWTFGSYAEFETVPLAMQTQFDMLMGNIPGIYTDTYLMIIYVIFLTLIQFFLMLNFFLAIVVEAYMKIREEQSNFTTDNELFTDISISMYHGFAGAVSRWPSRRALAKMMEEKLSLHNVSWLELHILGIKEKAARSLIRRYGRMSCLLSETDDMQVVREDVKSVVERTSQETQMQVTELKATVEKMAKQIAALASAPPPPAATDTQTTQQRLPSAESTFLRDASQDFESNTVLAPTPSASNNYDSMSAKVVGASRQSSSERAKEMRVSSEGAIMVFVNGQSKPVERFRA